MGSVASHSHGFADIYAGGPEWAFDWVFFKVVSIDVLQRAYTQYKEQYYPRINLTAREIAGILELRETEAEELVTRVGGWPIVPVDPKAAARKAMAGAGRKDSKDDPNVSIRAPKEEDVMTVDFWEALCLACLRSQLITDSVKVRYLGLAHDANRDGKLSKADIILLLRNVCRGLFKSHQSLEQAAAKHAADPAQTTGSSMQKTE